MSELMAVTGNNTSVAASSNQGAPVKADTGNAAQSIAQSGGQAAIVSLSASSTKRAASSGDKRSVDAAFDKQAGKEIEKKKEDGGEGSPKKNTVDVSA